MRGLKDGVLECFYGDDRWLTRTLKETGLASAYGYATVACGFRMLRHEGKLTGLAAYGEPKLSEEMAAQFRFDDKSGLIETDFRNWAAMREKFLGLCRGHDRETIAASIQKVAEDFTVQSVRHWLDRTGARKLAMAGGLFANVRLNRLLAETLPLDEVFVFPAMGDEGLSVGAALTFLHARDGNETWLRHRHRLDNVYLGQNYDGRIDDVLSSAGMRRLAGRPVETAVDLIRAGKAGAIYTGRMEFGPRALGARSIIASPHDHAINDLLNKRLDRSEFMPFAPFVLEEDAARVFEITDVNRYAAHFMTITCGVRPEWRARIPAVVHVDGTARPQIVRGDENPLFAAILRRFRDQTELPVLINTSFNVHEEPIVNRPEECLQALSDGRVDFVVTQQAVYVKG
jgi:carbamoyltransferase